MKFFDINRQNHYLEWDEYKKKLVLINHINFVNYSTKKSLMSISKK